MKFKTISALLWLSTVSAFAQTAKMPIAQPFGKIDKEDLQMKSCDFEKDANAMILFSTANVYFDTYNQVVEVHKRIKIFNENGKNEGNIKIPYNSFRQAETITGLQAETINTAASGEPEIIKLDKKVVYTENVDKYHSALVFSFPNVKAGSILEFKYRLNKKSVYLPNWCFRARIPVRYSELKTKVPKFLDYKIQSILRDPFAINKTDGDVTIRAMVNLHSVPDEPYMRSFADNLQGISFVLASVQPDNGFIATPPDTWAKIGEALNDDEDFGRQFKRKLSGEETLITKAKSLTTDQAKISYLFNEVKNNMAWDKTESVFTNDGTVKAWDKKTGNATEINLILYHLLNKSGVKAFPMVVSTRDNGLVNPSFTYINQFNRAVVAIPADSTILYVLDASNKYNSYTQIPDNLLGSTGFFFDKESKTYTTEFLENLNPAAQLVSVNADILPDASLSGTAQIISHSYNRLKNIKRYKTDGDEKYKDFLCDKDKTLKISSLKLDNMDVDTLPLVQTMAFKKDLTGSDRNYIYFVPAIFSPLHENPFLSETRLSDIDFSFRDNFTITANYKLPDGYKTETLPKNTTLLMPDQSIVFRRIAAQQDNSLVMRYSMDIKKTLYFKEDYDSLRDFYKKMQELLTEQIALKKS